MKKLFILSTILIFINNSECFSFWNYFKKEQVVEQQKAYIQVVRIPYNVEILDKLNELESIVNNPAIKVVLILIDNNGGCIDEYGLIYDALKVISQQKTIIAFITGNAYSGAYLLASTAHTIIAGTFSKVGSIGVVHQYTKATGKPYNTKENPSLEVTTEVYNAGKFKAIGEQFKPFTEEQKEYIQNEINKSYQIFIEEIAKNRNLDVANHLEWADGKTFCAQEALSLGLIDQIGNVFTATKVAEEIILENNPNAQIVSIINEQGNKIN